MPGSSRKQTIYLSDASSALTKAVQQAQRIFCRSGYKPEEDEDDAFSYFWSQTLPQCVPKRERSSSLMSPTITRKRAMSSSSMSLSTATASPKRSSDTQALAIGNNQVILALAYIAKLKKHQINLNKDDFTRYLRQNFSGTAFDNDVTEIVAFYQQLLEVLNNQDDSKEMISKFSTTAVGTTIRRELSKVSELTEIGKSKKCKTQQDIVRLLVETIRAYDLASTPYSLSYDRGHSSFSASSSSIPSSKPKPSRSGFFSCCCSADDSDDEAQSERLLTVTSYDKYTIN